MRRSGCSRSRPPHDVQMSDADVEAVMAFLRVLEPQLRALEEMVAPDTVPAALYLPTDTP